MRACPIQPHKKRTARHLEKENTNVLEDNSSVVIIVLNNINTKAFLRLQDFKTDMATDVQLADGSMVKLGPKTLKLSYWTVMAEEKEKMSMDQKEDLKHAYVLIFRSVESFDEETSEGTKGSKTSAFLLKKSLGGKPEKKKQKK